MTYKPLQVEVVAHVLGSMNHCSHCQVFIDGVGVGGQIKQADLNAYPREFMDDWQHLSDWVLALAARYPGQLVIKIIDAQSLQGLWQALRHNIHKYPAFIVEGKTYQGWQAEPDFITRLNQLLAERNQPVPVERSV